MKEWAESDKFNSFNSWKGLLYADWYKAVAAGKILPPIEASIDSIHACNLHCKHCNIARYRYDTESPQKMSLGHMMNLIMFLSEWGVKANCFGGGGEPTMNKDLDKALRFSKLCGMESSLSTNGTIMPDKLAQAIIDTCRWIGISVDAASTSTYKSLKDVDMFDRVIGNISHLVKLNKGTCDINYKFLISPINQYEILNACKLAKELGVRDFQARPMDYLHQGMDDLKGTLGNFDMGSIHTQFEECHELATNDFHVYTPTHKFDMNFHSGEKHFSHCYASGMIIQLCADGNVYYCIDQRHNQKLLLGTHAPDPSNILSFWGSQHHLDLMFGDTADKCTTRCTLGPYCSQCEKLFINKNDPMCINFA